MADVEFGDTQFTRRARPGKKTPIINLVKKVGLAKNDGQANLVLFVLSLIFFAIALYVIYVTFFPNLFRTTTVPENPEGFPGEFQDEQFPEGAQAGPGRAGAGA